MLDQVNSERPENVKPLKIIPVGEVIYQLEQKMKDGLVPGFNEAEDLYRDQFHLDNVGRFIAGTTFFATLFDEDPTPLSEPGEYWYLPNSETWGDVDSSISPELADIIQTTAWEVVSTQVPEPLTFMSLGTCMIGFIWSRKGK